MPVTNELFFVHVGLMLRCVPEQLQCCKSFSSKHFCRLLWLRQCYLWGKAIRRVRWFAQRSLAGIQGTIDKEKPVTERK